MSPEVWAALIGFVATITGVVLQFVLERHSDRVKRASSTAIWFLRILVPVAALGLCSAALWWFIHRGQVRTYAHGAEVTCVEFDPTGKRFFSGTATGVVRDWDIETGQYVPFRSSSLEVIDFVAGNDRFVVAGGHDKVVVWDRATRVERGLLEPDDPSVFAVQAVLLPDGKTALVAWWNGLVKYDLETRSVVQAFQRAGNMIEGMALDSSGTYVVTYGSAASGFQVWKVDSGEFQWQTNPGTGNVAIDTINESLSPAVRGLAFSSDQQLLFFAEHFSYVPEQQVNDIVAWDKATLRERRRYQGHHGRINGLVISSDDRFLLSGSDDGTVRLWDVDTGRERMVYRGHFDWPVHMEVTAVALSPDRRFALSASHDETVRLWELP